MITSKFFPHSKIAANFLTEKKRNFKVGAQSSSSSFSSTLAKFSNPPQVSYHIHFFKKGPVFLLSTQKIFLEGCSSNRKGLASKQSHEAQSLLSPSVPCGSAPLYPGDVGWRGRAPVVTSQSRLSSQVLPAWSSLPLCGLSSQTAILGFILSHSSCFSGDGP